MKAFQILDNFSIDSLKIVQLPDPKPEPEPGHVVVRLRAVSLNYRDLLIVSGLYNPNLCLPLIPCSDGAGEVIAVGDGVSCWKVGDKVAGTFFQGWVDGVATDAKCSQALGGDVNGVLAEYAVFDEHKQGLVTIPENLSFEEAACLPCAALTAWAALLSDNKLKAGQTVLTQGTGGVSIFAMQFAQIMGLNVIATSSSDAKLKKLEQFGILAGINYKSCADWDKEVIKLTNGIGVDHVIEVGGAGTLEQSLNAVHRGGHISLIGILSGVGKVNPMKILMKGLRVQGIYVGSRKMFEDMNRAISSKNIHPIVDKVFDFKESVEALKYLQSAKHFGKIVIKI